MARIESITVIIFLRLALTVGQSNPAAVINRKLEEEFDRAGQCQASGCFDESPHCAEMALNGSCFEYPANVAGDNFITCRSSCTAALMARNGTFTEKEYFAYLQLGEGFGPYVLDPGGAAPSPMCDPRLGMALDVRKELMLSHLTAQLALQEEPNQLGIPQFTEVGFKRSKIPKELFQDILAFRKRGTKRKIWELERCRPGVFNCYDVTYDQDECKVTPKTKTHLLWLADNLQKKIRETLLSEAEDFASESSESRIRLRASKVYGIRRYLRGAWLGMHNDHSDTHVVSAILNVAQKLSTPWPLYIVDWSHMTHRVELKPGEMLWYESARLPHGRIELLDGDYYDNIFLHYRPEDERDKKQESKNSDFEVKFDPAAF